MGNSFSGCQAATIWPNSVDLVQGKRILVTGATSGIGLCLIKALAERGAKVCGWGRNEDAIKMLTQEAMDKEWQLHMCKCDISDKEDISRAASASLDLLGGIDILVNNAGVCSGGKFITDLSDEEIQKTLDVNLAAHFWTIRAFLPKMLEQNSGHIITIDSVAGIMGVAGLTDYCASKFGAFGLTESLRFELAQRKANISTTIICPAYVQNDMAKNAEVKCALLFPLINETYVIQQIIGAIERKRALVVLPRTINLSYMARMYPVPMYDSVVRMWANV